MMKKLVVVIFVLSSFQVGFSRQSPATAKGNKVFVEGTSKNEDAVKVVNSLKDQLAEWSYWTVTSNRSDADVVMKVAVTASSGITAVSWGGTSYALTAQLIDKKGEVLWESRQLKASPNGTNGFNAGNAVVKKLMKALKGKYKS